MTILNPLARDGEEIVFISDAVRDHGDRYSCIDCGEVLIPRMGDVNVHHFSHKSTSACTGETAIHMAAKNIMSTMAARGCDVKISIGEPVYFDNHYVRGNLKMLQGIKNKPLLVVPDSIKVEDREFLNEHGIQPDAHCMLGTGIVPIPLALEICYSNRKTKEDVKKYKNFNGVVLEVYIKRKDIDPGCPERSIYDLVTRRAKRRVLHNGTIGPGKITNEGDWWFHGKRSFYRSSSGFVKAWGWENQIKVNVNRDNFQHGCNEESYECIHVAEDMPVNMIYCGLADKLDEMTETFYKARNADHLSILEESCIDCDSPLTLSDWGKYEPRPSRCCKCATIEKARIEKERMAENERRRVEEEERKMVEERNRRIRKRKIDEELERVKMKTIRAEKEKAERIRMAEKRKNERTIRKNNELLDKYENVILPEYERRRRIEADSLQEEYDDMVRRDGGVESTVAAQLRMRRESIMKLDILDGTWMKKLRAARERPVFYGQYETGGKCIGCGMQSFSICTHCLGTMWRMVYGMMYECEQIINKGLKNA